MPLVTTARIRAVYLMLRAMPPYDRWQLPEPAQIKFELLSVVDNHYGDFNVERAKHSIRIHPHMHASIQGLTETVAHEMVHLRQELLGRLPAGKDPHNAEFRRLAHLVCSRLGFDVTRF